MKLRWHFDSLTGQWFVRIFAGNRMGKEYAIAVEQAPVFLASIAAGVSGSSSAVAEQIMEQFVSNPQSGAVVLH